MGQARADSDFPTHTRGGDWVLLYGLGCGLGGLLGTRRAPLCGPGPVDPTRADDRDARMPRRRQELRCGWGSYETRFVATRAYPRRAHWLHHGASLGHEAGRLSAQTSSTSPPRSRDAAGPFPLPWVRGAFLLFEGKGLLEVSVRATRVGTLEVHAKSAARHIAYSGKALVVGRSLRPIAAGAGQLRSSSFTSPDLVDMRRNADASLPSVQGFADPMNNNRPFIYPANTGIAYSFTDDGYFEEAQYRFNSNGARTALLNPRCPQKLTPSSPASEPHCATAVVIWQHGKYYFHTNGSLTLDPAPFVADGRIQVQDPCAATTEVLTYYSQFELYNAWTISIDTHHAAYVMQLYRFDGSLFPR